MNIIRNHYKKLGYENKYLDIRLKEFKKQVILNIIILFIGVFIIGILLYTYLFSPDYFVGKIVNPIMNKISNLYESDNIIMQTSNLCNNFYSDEDKIKCVNHFFTEFYEYDEHKNQSNVFANPQELINIGGCCRDASLFYSSVFSLMGFTNEFIYEPNHIYNKICKEECWIIDQTYLEKVEN